MSPHDDLPFRPHANAVLRRVGDGAVLVHLDTGRVFELNDTAARIWELVAAGRIAADIVAVLQDEYAGDSAVVAREVDELIDRWLQEGLLVR